jgi:hypothetical protein
MGARSGWLGRVTMMWIPSHVGIAGNEAADLGLGRLPVEHDFIPNASKVMLQDSQQKWTMEDIGHFTHFSHLPWFADWKAERKVITITCSIIVYNY